MKWLASIVVAVLTAILGLFAAAVVGGLLADWYRVTSFEGAAGFFVVGIAFAGLLASFAIGLVTSRIVAARPNPGFAKALGWSCGVVLGILAVIAGAGRMLADIPPTLEGDTLYLQVELRWPAAGGADPHTLPGAGYTRLGTSTGSIVRRQEDGPLFVEDARQEDGRWIVPGAVDVFTARGQRVLEVGIGETRLGAFVVPLPGHPRRDQQTWSDWLPHARSGAAPLPDQFTYRFRVVRQSEPLRVERAGPFEVAAIVRYFYNVQGTDRMAANSVFHILYTRSSTFFTKDSRSADSRRPSRSRWSPPQGPPCSCRRTAPTAVEPATCSSTRATAFASTRSPAARRPSAPGRLRPIRHGSARPRRSCRFPAGWIAPRSHHPGST